METPYVGSSRDPPLLTCIRLDIFLELATISSTHSWRDCPRRTKCHGVHEQAELLAFCVLEQSRPVICLVNFNEAGIGDIYTRRCSQTLIKRTNPVPGTPSPTTDSRGWLQNVCAKERVVLGFSGHLVNYELCRQTPAPVAASNNNEVYIYVVSVLTTSQEYECWFVVLIILKNLKVNGKDYPIYYGKQNLETTNQ